MWTPAEQFAIELGQRDRTCIDVFGVVPRWKLDVAGDEFGFALQVRGVRIEVHGRFDRL